jgi:hypothetical protein
MKHDLKLREIIGNGKRSIEDLGTCDGIVTYGLKNNCKAEA